MITTHAWQWRDIDSIITVVKKSQSIGLLSMQKQERNQSKYGYMSGWNLNQPG